MQAKAIQALRVISPFLFIVSAIVFFAGCASNDEVTSTEQATYFDAQRALRVGNWNLAIQKLEYLEENFPFSRYAEQAQLELIYAYHKANDQELAMAAADRFIRLHPQHHRVDYAYYMRGVASFNNETALNSFISTDVTRKDPGGARDAFKYFAQLINTFPSSPYAADAKQRMTYVRNVLARNEIHVANYYFKRGAYLAAANRGRYVVESMQQTPAVPDGLAVMAQAYHYLDMPELSENAAKVLVKNFPDHPAIKDGKFNYQFVGDGKRSWFSYLTFGVFDKNKFAKYDSRRYYNAIYGGEVSPPPSANHS